MSSHEFVTDGDITRTFKAALRKVFSCTKFSVTRGGSRIEWTDDDPAATEEAVKAALLTVKGVETRLGWKNEQIFEVRGNWIYLIRYNIAERAAEEADRVRRAAEDELRRQHADAAVKAAAQAKRDALARPPSDRSIPAETPADTFATFEQLRQRAENDAATDDDAERQGRPSWAPPLIIASELRENCVELGLLAADAKPIVRLWAQFADPKKPGTALRETRSNLPLTGIQCRGFTLHAGTERGATSDILFEAQRDNAGKWRFGPRINTRDYRSPRASEWERAVHSHETAVRGGWSPRDVQQLAAEIAAIDAQDREAAAKFYRRQYLWARVVELARDRVLEFAGSPGAQMALASRLWGHCFNCGKELTDPISLEMGIGPDCLHGKVASAWINHDRGADVASIAFGIGMPEEFVTATLAAPRPRYRVPLEHFPIAYFDDGRCIAYRRDGPGVAGVFNSRAEMWAWIEAATALDGVPA